MGSPHAIFILKNKKKTAPSPCITQGSSEFEFVTVHLDHGSWTEHARGRLDGTPNSLITQAPKEPLNRLPRAEGVRRRRTNGAGDVGQRLAPRSLRVTRRCAPKVGSQCSNIKRDKGSCPITVLRPSPPFAIQSLKAD